MALMDILLHRRSVRSYSDAPVTREQLEQIVRAGLLSPTGKNVRGWQFVIVQDRATLDRFTTMRAGGSGKMLAGASAAIFVFGGTTTSDVWCEDCSIAMTSMHYMADELGLGSCWIQGRLREAEDGRSTSDFCREILGVPENFELEAVLSIGNADTFPAPHTLGDADMAKVHWDRF